MKIGQFGISLALAAVLLSVTPPETDALDPAVVVPAATIPLAVLSPVVGIPVMLITFHLFGFFRSSSDTTDSTASDVLAYVANGKDGDVTLASFIGKLQEEGVELPEQMEYYQPYLDTVITREDVEKILADAPDTFEGTGGRGTGKM